MSPIRRIRNWITRTTESTARYRTTSLAVVAWLLTWADNAYGIDVTEEVADWTTLSEGTVEMGFVAGLCWVLYFGSQKIALVDKIVHPGASNVTPTYESKQREA